MQPRDVKTNDDARTIIEEREFRRAITDWEMERCFEII